MPMLKAPKLKEPLWKENDYKAQKRGFRTIIYSVDGDCYIGEWFNNLKHGRNFKSIQRLPFGTKSYGQRAFVYQEPTNWEQGFLAALKLLEKRKHSKTSKEYIVQQAGFQNIKIRKGTYNWKVNGAIYDGDWKYGKHNGFGTYSIPDVKNKDGFVKVYSGAWKNDKKHGYGTHFYTDEEYYEGEWYADKRNGWGRMYYKNGTIYEGEWFDNKRNGQGMLQMFNENRYEGSWRDDKKNGRGKFYYLTHGQLYDGVWVDDIAKCGTVTDFDRNSAPEPTLYPIPKVELANPAQVLQETEDMFFHERE